MNKAYKVVYNESTGTYVAVSELETSKGKATSISNTTTQVSVNTPKSLTGRFVLGKLVLSLLGLSTLFAMPLAHASWINGSTGGGTSGGTGTAYGTASGDGIAIGAGTGVNKATASGGNAIAIGSSAIANAQYAVAIGRVSIASGENSTALGNNSKATGTSAVAVGSSSIASGVEHWLWVMMPKQREIMRLQWVRVIMTVN